MPSGQPSRSQPTQPSPASSLATKPARKRSPLRTLLRLIVLLVFLGAAAYLAHAIWSGVQYMLTPQPADLGVVPSMVALPGFGLSIGAELAVGLGMLALFIGSPTLLLATRPRRGSMTVPASSTATGTTFPHAPSDSSPTPEPPADSPSASEPPADDAPARGERQSLPLLPHMLIPTLPPEEAALLVPPAETPAEEPNPLP
ncbi:MAG TPA: hypothetical protein VF120_05695 [Ktedonobacterales bacterium]